jgi:hypothetical protein
VTSVVDTFLLKVMLSMEWRVRPLGLPQRYPEGEALAVEVEVSEAALRSTYRTKNVAGPVLSGLAPRYPRIPAAVRRPEARVPLPGPLITEPMIMRHLTLGSHGPRALSATAL